MTEPMDFPAFRDYLAGELDIELGERGPQHRLADDVEFDSLQRLEILVAIEDLGVQLPDDSVEPQQTLGELHKLYTEALLTRSEN